MDIRIVTREEADRSGTHEEQALLEQSPGHYPEFWEFLKAELELSGGNLFFEAPSKTIYRAGLVAANGPHELSGLEICGRTHSAGQTLTSEVIDGDLWAFLEWLIRGVGGEWSVADLRQVGEIYRVLDRSDRA